MTEHTPGPWEARESDPSEGFDCWWIEDANGESVADAHGYQSDAAKRANSRLIAAAPELLGALEAVEWVGGRNGVPFYCPWCQGMYPGHRPECLRQGAISKARGEGDT